MRSIFAELQWKFLNTIVIVCMLSVRFLALILHFTLQLNKCSQVNQKLNIVNTKCSCT